MKKILYAILDIVADDIGPIVVLRHDAAAVRMFHDVLAAEGTMPNKHPADFHLVRLGYLSPDHQLIQDWAVILTGQAWQQTQTKPDANQLQLVENQ